MKSGCGKIAANCNSKLRCPCDELRTTRLPGFHQSVLGSARFCVVCSPLHPTLSAGSTQLEPRPRAQQAVLVEEHLVLRQAHPSVCPRFVLPDTSLATRHRDPELFYPEAVLCATMWMIAQVAVTVVGVAVDQRVQYDSRDGLGLHCTAGTDESCRLRSSRWNTLASYAQKH